jgi:hypothetical protein
MSMLISSNKSTDTHKLVNKHLDYNPIYKVKYLVNGSIDTIFIFNGKKKENENEKELYKTIFKDDKEIDEIHSKKLSPPIFSEQKIHYDDSISTIKIKILTELKNKLNKTVSLDELYLFCQKKETLNAVSLYQSLTQNKKLELTQVRLDQFISNIVSNENGNIFKPPPKKDVYTFDDILEMKIDDQTYIIDKVLGQKFFIVENEYPFVCNPYNIKGYDAFFEKNSRKSLSTLNSHLLLNSGYIVNNNIYLCLASDILNFVSKKNISQETTLKIYFPFLYNKNIKSLEDLQNEQERLIENNKKVINDKTDDLFKTISMFYDVYKLKKTDLRYVDKGIKYIKAIIKPEFEINIPLEIIFKIIHATEKNPFIKYNPSTRQENIYRLYTDKISTDGRKIPYLKKTTIFKLMKTIAKTKSVSVFIEFQMNDTQQTIICEFDENGYITISSEFVSIISETDIDALFRDAINPIINEIKNLLQQSGYKLNLFRSLYDENVEIKQLTYVSQIKISKPVDLETYKGCISSIFNNESSEFKTGIHLRFKRVSNFSKVSSQEAFILEKSAEGFRGSDIIEALMENYPDDLTRNQAEELVRKVANEIQVERGVRKSDIKIKNNPGFKTTIMLEQKIGTITITVENINDIHYLQTIPVYLDTMIRLTQDKNSTNYPVQEINKLCSAGVREEILIKDIISSTEKSADDVEVPFLEQDEEIVEYQKYKSIQTEKPKGAFSLFYDEDEGDEEEFEGGQPNSSSSEESISSDKSSSLVESPKNEEIIVAPTYENTTTSSSEEVVESPKIETVVEKENVAEEVVESPKIETVVEKENVAEEVVESPKIETVVEKENVAEEVVESPKIETVVEQENVAEEEKNMKRIPVESSSSSMPELEPGAPSEKVEEKASDVSEDEEEDVDQVRNIDGMKLNKPYYFQTLIENKDPILILKEDSAQYNAYSRTCSSDTRRQPVILTDEQLAKINKDHKGFLRDEDVIKYGSDPNNKFNYICPRYWCLKTNTIVDPRDLKEVIGKDGKKELEHPTCGKVIPRKDKEVKPGYYIYEFYEEPERKKIDVYEKTFKKYDTDKDGFINFDELKKILQDLKEIYNERTWSEQYNKINNNRPTASQIQEFLQKQDINIRGMFDYADTDKDDKINLDEFIYITTPKKYPGLIPDKHPKGLCLPCCFDKYNTDGRIAANQKCFEENKKLVKPIKKDLGKKKEIKNIEEKQLDITELENVVPVENVVPDETIIPAENVVPVEKAIEKRKVDQPNPEEDEYIKSPDKFPLTAGRWGYLPYGIEKMLHQVNADCQISKTNTNIKPNHSCLLRHGIEVNQKQSFIACISDIMFFNKLYFDNETKTKKFRKILDIKEMRERIKNSITIDTFVTYQNGNLVTDFHNMQNSDNIDVKKYKDTTKFFEKLNIENVNDLYYMKKVISAFENFKSFLNDDDAIIDHTYLWDIMSMPNKGLFEAGLNLVIFQLPNDDITNNVQLLCPTNHYSKEFYNSKKPTAIIVKQDDYYEPIYSYTIKEKLEIITQFKETGQKISPKLIRVLDEIVKLNLDNICKPLNSMPNVYKAKKPLILYELLKELKAVQYNIEKIVINFNNKAIGVVAEEPKTGRSGFVPCYPSLMPDIENYDYVFMNDLRLWNTYYNTVSFLSTLEKRTKNRKNPIHCKPAFKILEDEWVVGILTETNQFIQLSKPIAELEANDDFVLPSVKDEQYIVNKNINKDTKPLIQIDIPISTSNNVDEERVEYIQKTKMETGFYNVFRNTIRILLNDYENVKVREEIEKELTKEYIIYSEKLVNVYKSLKKLVYGNKEDEEIKEENGLIQFTGNENYYKLINQISTCVVKNEDECDTTPNLCTFTKNGRCNLILPKLNLITKKENKPIYFKRIADELIRYSRINSFMLQPQSYLSFGNIGYNLNDNEIIMIQSLLTQEYFETLVPATLNKYTKYNSYDEVEPIITQTYENTVPSVDEVIEFKTSESCDIPKVNKAITSGIWKKCFPENYKEIEYNDTIICSFQIIIDLIEKYTGVRKSINQIKNELYNEYKQYLDKYQDKIIDILIIEGKKTIGRIAKDKKGGIDFPTFISDVDYFLTTLDLWILIEKYKIPTIFISQTCILQTKYEKHAFLSYGKEEDDFVFIVLPGFNENKPKYKIIQNNNGEIFISTRYLTCVEYINEIIQNKMTIEEYLSKFTKHLTTKYQVKTKCKEIDMVHQEIEKKKKGKLKIVNEEEKEIEIKEIEIKEKEIKEKPKKQGTKKNNELKEKPATKKNVSKKNKKKSSSSEK